MINFENFATKVTNDSHLADLIERYDMDTDSLTEDELNEMVIRAMIIMDETNEIYPDDYYEDWDNLEMGFDPYMGCYSDDC